MSANRRVIDLLDVDEGIPTDQRFGVFSFAEPPSDIFESYESFCFMAYLRKCGVKFILSRLHGSKLDLNTEELIEEFQDFKRVNEKFLRTKFSEANGDCGTTRLMKCRGCYPTIEKAQERARILTASENDFTTVCLQNGYWVPYNPNIRYLKEGYYTDKKLNEIMRSHYETKKKASQYAIERKRVLMQKILEENPESKNAKKKVEEYNNMYGKLSDAEYQKLHDKYSNFALYDKVIQQETNEVAEEIEYIENEIREKAPEESFKLDKRYEQLTKEGKIDIEPQPPSDGFTYGKYEKPKDVVMETAESKNGEFDNIQKATEDV